MKILVTGGAGFIGSALAKTLVQNGHQVVVIDNFDPYYAVTLKRDRVHSLIPNIPVDTIDIRDKSTLRTLFETGSFDVVCHLASQPGVRYSIENPEIYITTNIVGTQNILDVMKEYGVKQMVFASTSSVYGVDTPVPFSEQAPANKPVSLYSATKRSAELIAYWYYQQFGIQTTALRFFTVYGPWGRPDMALYKFAELMYENKPIQIYNNGKHTRDFTYIDDIVSGIVTAIEQPHGFEIVNLGSGKQIELMVYIELLEKALGITAIKEMLPLQPGDVNDTWADIAKAERLLGYNPTVSVEEGVQRFAEWFLAYKSRNR